MGLHDLFALIIQMLPAKKRQIEMRCYGEKGNQLNAKEKWNIVCVGGNIERGELPNNQQKIGWFRQVTDRGIKKPNKSEKAGRQEKRERREEKKSEEDKPVAGIFVLGDCVAGLIVEVHLVIRVACWLPIHFSRLLVPVISAQSHTHIHTQHKKGGVNQRNRWAKAI